MITDITPQARRSYYPTSRALAPSRQTTQEKESKEENKD